MNSLAVKGERLTAPESLAFWVLTEKTAQAPPILPLQASNVIRDPLCFVRDNVVSTVRGSPYAKEPS